MQTEKSEIKFDLPLENGGTVKTKAQMTTKVYFDNDCEQPNYYADVTVSYAGRSVEIKHVEHELTIYVMEKIEEFLGTKNFKIYPVSA